MGTKQPPTRGEQLRTEMRRHVIGQDAAVDELIEQFGIREARALSHLAGTPTSDLPALSPILIQGPTASGKTFSVRSLAEACGYRVVLVDCTTLTGSGWSGGDLSNRLYRAAEHQIEEQAPVVIVFDEVDKIVKDTSPAYRSFNPVFDLLPLFDGGIYNVQPGTAGSSKSKDLELDLDGVIFILMGAFTGIEEVVEKRLHARHSPFGLSDDADDGASPENLRAQVESRDLLEWGFPRELVGRIGRPIYYPLLSKSVLADIAQRSTVPRYQNIMPRGRQLDITREAAEYTAEMALESVIGARSIDHQLQPLVAQARERFESDPRVSRETISLRDGGLILAEELGSPRADDGVMPARSGAEGPAAQEIEIALASLSDNDTNGPLWDACRRFEDAFGRRWLLRIAESRNIDKACRALLGDASAGFRERQLLKAAIEYTAAVYGPHDRRPPDVPPSYREENEYPSMWYVLSLLPLVHKDDPKQEMSPLDVVIFGAKPVYGDDGMESPGFEGLRQCGRFFDGNAAMVAGAACADYQIFAESSDEEQERTARNIVRRFLLLGRDRRAWDRCCAVLGECGLRNKTVQER